MPDSDNKPASQAQVQLIARDAAAAAINLHKQELPGLMKPIIYEVAERVADRSQKDFLALFSNVMGANVKDDEHVRDLHKDLYWLREKRVAQERRVTVAYDSMIGTASRWTLWASIMGLLAFIGIKFKG